MGEYIELKVTGFKELGEKLKALGPKIEANGLRSTAYAGAAVVLKAAKQTAAFADRTKTLRKNMVVGQNKLRSKEHSATYSVFVKKAVYPNTKKNRSLKRVGKKLAGTPPAVYGKFLEYGTSRMRARAWLRPAFAATSDEAIEAMRVRLGKAVEDAVR